MLDTNARLELHAYAKINLGLHVTAKRPDGYHNIDSLMLRLDVHDTLRLEARPADYGISLEVTGAALPDDANNLAYRAAERYAAAAAHAVKVAVAIQLEKHIPIAAGLGGGSSDAAAVLRALARLFPAPIDLLSLAASLGADVPFFVADLAAARAQGIGEQLSPLTLPPLALVLVYPQLEVSAASAYQALRQFSPPLELDNLLSELHNAETLSCHNSLEAGVVARHPAVAKALATLQRYPLRNVMMSGSGSSCFGIAADNSTAQSIAAQLAAEQPSWWVRACSSG